MLKEFKSIKTFRYKTSGNPETAKTLLFVLHGYGQLVEYFLKKFNGLNEQVFIVAPEGMHRFYLKGNSGRVGASWMTKEAREIDIADNINWLNELNEHIQHQHKFETSILLGFSQGGATAARWCENSAIPFDHLIMWASVFPPDLVLNELSLLHDAKKKYFVLGNDDPYFKEEQTEQTTMTYKSLGFSLVHFNGKHDIHVETLTSILKDLESLSIL